MSRNEFGQKTNPAPGGKVQGVEATKIKIAKSRYWFVGRAATKEKNVDCRRAANRRNEEELKKVGQYRTISAF